MKNDWAMDLAEELRSTHWLNGLTITAYNGKPEQFLPEVATIIRRHSAPRDAAVRELVEASANALFEVRDDARRFDAALAAVREGG